MQNTLFIVLCAGAALVLVVPSDAQDQETARDEIADLREQLANVLSRLDALEAKHIEERDEDRQRIAELHTKLQELQDGALNAERAQILAQMADRLRAEQPEPAAQLTFELAPTAAASTSLLNPAITVFIETGGSISSRGRNKALNRFNLREAEIDFRAAIAPFADGTLVITLGEEIEQFRSGDITVERVVDIEEGYINFHTLPWDLSLKIGKFHNAFGSNNLLHIHDLPQVTRPLPVKAFLGTGGEGLITTGASLSWLIPNPWDKYFELTGELVNADGGEESPLLGGPNAENPAFLAHFKFFDDVGQNGTLELGATYLFAHSDGDSAFDGHTFALDAAYQWVHPDPSLFRSFILQGEFFWSHNDVNRGFFGSDTNDSFGFYAFGQYQFHRDWYAGLRYDFTEFPNSLTRGSDDWDWGLSPYVSWYINEFVRVRTEYQHRGFNIGGNSSSEEVLFVQLTFLFGSHPPHPYWVNR